MTLKKILYAEDEEDIRTIATMVLEEIGNYTIHSCQNGLEAVNSAEEFKPDLILLDVMMPEMDGPTALTEIHKIKGLQNVPAIFMTAKVQAKEIELYKSMGAIEVISKPFDPMMLTETIEAIWKNSKK